MSFSLNRFEIGKISAEKLISSAYIGQSVAAQYDRHDYI